MSGLLIGRRRGATRGGMLTIIGILAIALAFALGNAAYQWRRSARPVAFWGNEVARRILLSKKVEAAHLEPMSGSRDGQRDAPAAVVAEDELMLEGERWHLGERREVGAVPGFSHVRRMLLQSSAYDWNEHVPSPLDPRRQSRPPSNSAYALGFHDQAASANPARRIVWLVFFDEGLCVSRVGSGRWASLRPAAPGLMRFFEVQFASDSRAASSQPVR